VKFIDLFAGAGGFSEGFRKAGLEPLAHVEADPAACLTLKTRLSCYYLRENNKADSYEKYLKGEISRDDLYSLVPSALLESVINSFIGEEGNPEIFKAIDKIREGKEIDLIIGGPPCQAYSLVGRARDENKMCGDPRSYLYIHYGRFLSRYKPKLFVFENVAGLLSAEEGMYFKNLQKYFRRIGYVVKPFTVNARDFGVLQNRTRVIIVGWRKDTELSIDSLYKITSEDHKVSSVFEDLPKIKAGEGNDKNGAYASATNDYLSSAGIRKDNLDILTQHAARPHTEQDKEIYRIAVEKWNKDKTRLDYNDLPERLKTHQNTHSFTDRFKVVAKNLAYSHTIVAHLAKDGHYYIHPDIEQNRSISVREAARLQSFPDDYYFEGAGRVGQIRTPAFRQIGNAVPPLMIEKIAGKLLECLKS
jgi:DNA (cytosine-5)-methyltransferase 1